MHVFTDTEHLPSVSPWEFGVKLEVLIISLLGAMTPVKVMSETGL